VAAVLGNATVETVQRRPNRQTMDSKRYARLVQMVRELSLFVSSASAEIAVHSVGYYWKKHRRCEAESSTDEEVDLLE